MSGAENFRGGFRLRDLVLAKFDEYPYWPAVVKKCFWKEGAYHGTWRQAETGDSPERLWCSFVGDNSANWVPVQKIKAFTPRLARRWQCRRKTRNYAAQQAAIEAAERMYQDRLEHEILHHVEDEAQQDLALEGASRSVGSGDSGAGNSDSSTSGCETIDNSSVEEGARGAGQKRSYVDLDGPIVASKRRSLSVISRRKEAAEVGAHQEKAQGGCRDDEVYEEETSRRHGENIGRSEVDVIAALRRAIQKNEDDLTLAKMTECTLNRKIQLRNAWIEEFKKRKMFAEVPDLPLHTQLPLPAEIAYQSTSLSGEELKAVLEELGCAYASFKKKLEKCSALREALDIEISEHRSELGFLGNEIEKVEQQVRDDQVSMAKALTQLLEAKVDLNDLRKTRAGKLVASIKSTPATATSDLYLQRL